MAEAAPYPDTSDDPGAGPARRSTTAAPRWVKVSAVLALVLVALVGVMVLMGGGPGGHGPGRHTGTGDAGGRTPPAGEPPSVQEGHTPPSGVPDHGAGRP